MTGRTHDLAAFTMLNMAFVVTAPLEMSAVTLIGAVGANMIGGLLPDIDEAAADIWDKIRWGHIIGKMIKPLIGGHRMISHSILGMVIIGYVLKLLLTALESTILVDMDIIWWSTMIGYFSHLVIDSFTTEGVPWLLPVPFRFGFPPFRFSRMKTGGFLEKGVVFPGLLLSNVYVIYAYYPLYTSFLKNYIA